jgi:hypothetical protein
LDLSSKLLRNVDKWRPVTMHRVPEDLILHQHRSANLTSRKFNIRSSKYDSVGFYTEMNNSIILYRAFHNVLRNYKHL